jgi:hypothetical protein
LGWFKLDLHSGVSVWFKGYLENVWVIFKVLSHSHQVDVVVKAEVRVDHDNSERIHWHLNLHSQESLEDVGQLGDDSLTIKEIAASSNLNGTIWKNLHRLGTVTVVIS